MIRDNSYLFGNTFAKGHKPTNAFKKGGKPWNKGVKGIHLSPDTQFKKGHKQNNTMPVGAITIRTSKRMKTRQYIKISEPNKWEEYAKWLWKRKYGYLLRGDVVHHLDGNSVNDLPDNILAIPRSDHPKIHGRWGLKSLSEEQIKFYISRYTTPAMAGLMT